MGSSGSKIMKILLQLENIDILQSFHVEIRIGFSTHVTDGFTYTESDLGIRSTHLLAISFWLEFLLCHSETHYMLSSVSKVPNGRK